MNQELTDDEIEEILEDLNDVSETDIISQRLFFEQTEIIRQKRIHNERVLEALKSIASNNPSDSARKEASKTLSYLGISPPAVRPELINKQTGPSKFFSIGFGLLLVLDFVLLTFVGGGYALYLLCPITFSFLVTGIVASRLKKGVVTTTIILVSVFLIATIIGFVLVLASGGFAM